MALVADRTFRVADALIDPDAFDWPKCATCGQAMRLVGMEPDLQHAHISVHTYECICGEVAVGEVTNN
jgi:hypothetical protein